MQTPKPTLQTRGGLESGVSSIWKQGKHIGALLGMAWIIQQITLELRANCHASLQSL